MSNSMLVHRPSLVILIKDWNSSTRINPNIEEEVTFFGGFIETVHDPRDESWIADQCFSLIGD